ncbi:MAG TPA: rod shape-determining protein MreD [Candidatus Binatia bacterium]|nr:rod shape-determining protein MreD [Candidatus Binatia bacterium]
MSLALRPTFGQQIDLTWRRSIPVALAILLLFLGILPWNGRTLGPVSANLVLIPIYYWTLHRPRLMSVWSVAALGLISDLLGVTQLGVGMLTMLIGYRVAVSQRKVFAGAPFIVVWAGFLLMSGVAGIVQWFLVSVLQKTLVDPRPALLFYMIGGVFYPLVAYVFALIQKRSLVRVA